MLENLTYDQYRTLALDGDVVFFRGSKSSWIQSLIMFATGSQYAHCGVAFWITINDKPRLMIVESQGGTSRRILTMSYYDNRQLDIVRAPIPWVVISDEALSQLGKTKYSYVDAIYVGVREYMWRRWSLRLPMLNSSGEICSEFLARLYEFSPTTISPGLLYEKLKVLYPSK